MGVDVFDVSPVDASVFDGTLHAEAGTIAFRMRSGDVIGVARHADPHEFGIDVSASLQGVFQLFQDYAAAAFAHDETIAVLVERTRCRRRVVVADRQRMHGIETADARLADACLCTASQHSSGFASTDQVESGDDGVR